MKFKQKFISSVIALGLVSSSMFISNANTEQLEVHYINVGQGDSTYIELPDGTDILIDAGKSNAGSTVVNYLKNQEKNIDIEYLIATHPDADHVGGMQQVFKDLDVKNFIYPYDAPHDTKTWENVLELSKQENCNINDATDFNLDHLDTGIVFECVQGHQDYDDNNNDSVVTYMGYNNVNFLFTGDIEEKAEKAFIEFGWNTEIDFMSVPHHGSSTSSSIQLLKQMKPKNAIISVGENSYGHPTQEVLDRYASIGSKVYRTDKLGNIVVKTDGNNSIINGNNVSSSNIPSDISGHWAENQIKDFMNKGYLNGYPDGTFKPQSYIKRGEFVKTLNKAFGLNTKSGKVFEDTVNHWAKDEIDIAVTNGVCEGTSATTFDPEAYITREAAAKMIANYKKISDKNHDKLNKYNDGNKVSSWAKNEVEAILEAGYMNGYSEDNTFKPTNKITRAEAVVTLGRVLANPNPVMPIPPVEDTSLIVYANGGSSSSNKYHKSANAHGMKDAIKMTENDAKKKGYVACGTCFR